MTKQRLAWSALLAALCSMPVSRLAAQDAEAPPMPAGPSEAEVEADNPGARTAKNLFFVELLGNGGLYTINYARFIGDDVDVRIGLDYFSLSASSGSSSGNATIVIVPLTVSYLGLGSADHKFEMGLGPVLAIVSASVDSPDGLTSGSGAGIGGTAILGYRYVPHDGGVTFNVGFTPIFGQGGFVPWGGIGIGGAF